MGLGSVVEILSSFSIQMSSIFITEGEPSRIVIFLNVGPLLKKSHVFVRAVGLSYKKRAVNQNKLKKK